MKQLSFKRLLVFIFIIVFVSGAVTGCATTKTGDTSSSGGNNKALLQIADWKDKYPDVYNSYMSGMHENKDKDGLPHSHVFLRQSLEVRPTFHAETGGGGACLVCKTADTKTLYEEYGEDFLSMSYLDFHDKVGDFFSCYICHEDNPEEKVGATSVVVRKLAGDYFDKLAPADAACGQCHNALSSYIRRVVSAPGDDLDNLRPYRYGTDADALMKAYMEDGGDKLLFEDKDGVKYFLYNNAQHPEVEMFQGSTHQARGLTCASCHMPKETSAAGEYTNHNSSGSVLKNETALNYCLTCHKAQGIESTEAMVTFVKDKQGELIAMHKDVQNRLDKLHGLIVEGTSDKDVDKKARELYIKAKWYKDYSDAGTQVPGTKAPMGFSTMMNYLQRAAEVTNEAIALYN